ncbi:MAG: HNH endonuclease [Chloroflexi bacterium]|nr:HNH endonuclease [Chloroflexota bacterium]
MSEISESVRARVRVEAKDRCGYCLSSQRYVFAPLEIDHIIPQAHDGTDDEENLWLACRMCNNFKGTHTHARDPLTDEIVSLFDPRRQGWRDHFVWSENGTQIVGRTAIGRATVVALRLNNLIAVMVRREWVAAGWHPPQEI